MLRTARRGGAGTTLGEGRSMAAVSLMVSHSLDVVAASFRHSGAVRRTEPGISRFRVRLFEAPRNDYGGESRAHQPSSSALRGSSTVLTFSSLIVPLAMRSLSSPSVAPEILV